MCVCCVLCLCVWVGVCGCFFVVGGGGGDGVCIGSFFFERTYWVEGGCGGVGVGGGFLGGYDTMEYLSAI